MTLSQVKLFSSVCNQLGLSKQLTSQLSKEIERWLAANGVGWTVNRLKVLKSAYLSFINYQDYELPWIAHRLVKGFRVPKGPWKFLWQRGGSAEQARTLRVLHAYSLFTENEVTHQQKEKFLNAVWSVPVPTSKGILDLIGESTSYLINQEGIPKRRPYMSKSDRHMWFYNLKTRHRRRFLEDVVRFKHLVDNGKVPMASVFRLYREDPDNPVKMFFLETDLVRPDPSYDFVGRLGWVQERGAKLRVFAMPNLVIQYLLEPLKRDLLRLLQCIPQDCTFNQMKGAEWARDKLSSGAKLWSVDLSNATDQFPLDVQRAIAPRITHLKDELELFFSISHGKYHSDPLSGGEGSYVRWMRGQPLGAGPSFPLFALAHHAVVWTAARNVGVDARDTYRIVGDDIIISDLRLYEEYRSILASLEVSVSESKTLLASSKVAEFVGHTVFEDGNMIPSTKWRDDIHVGNANTWKDVLRHQPKPLLVGSLNRAKYRLWYTLTQSNFLGWSLDRRSELLATFYVEQERKRSERTVELERLTSQSLYYQLLSTGKVKPSDQDGESFDRDHGNTVMSKSIPLVSLTQADRLNYVSNIDESNPIKHYVLGEVAALWKSVNELLTDAEKRALAD